MVERRYSSFHGEIKVRLLKYLNEIMEKRAPKSIAREHRSSDLYKVRFLTHKDKEYTFQAVRSFGEWVIYFNHKGKMENLKGSSGYDAWGYIFYCLDKFLNIYNPLQFKFSGADDELAYVYALSTFKNKVKKNTGYSFSTIDKDGNFVYITKVSEDFGCRSSNDQSILTVWLEDLRKVNENFWHGDFVPYHFFKNNNRWYCTHKSVCNETHPKFWDNIDRQRKFLAKKLKDCFEVLQWK